MFEQLGTLLKLGYEVTETPKCMRRTYQDLCRAANVADIVTRSISGHATEDMQRHYSTVSADEMRAGLAAVIARDRFVIIRSRSPCQQAANR
jgi:hypothetical protein